MLIVGGDSPGDDAGGQQTGSPKTSTSPKEAAKNNSSHNNRSNPNNSNLTPHLLDAPLQGATCQRPDQTPALVILESKNSPKNASVGVSTFDLYVSISINPVIWFEMSKDSKVQIGILFFFTIFVIS